MKVTFKTETEIIRELEINEMTNEIQSELESSFDNKPILKYEICFKEGVLVKDCHRLEDIDEEIVSAIAITIASKATK